MQHKRIAYVVVRRGTESDLPRRGGEGRCGQPAGSQAQGLTREVRVFAEDVVDSARELRVCRNGHHRAVELTSLSLLWGFA